MTTTSQRVMVLCSHSGRLINYSALLNHLEFYQVSLCQSLEQVREVLTSRQVYSLFIYDDFEPEFGGLMMLKLLSQRNIFSQLVLVGCFSDEQKMVLFQWAWRNHVPLLGVLDKPIKLAQLRDITNSMILYDGEDDKSICAVV